MANSVDPDETPRSAASHLGLYCLLRPVCLNIYSKYGNTEQMWETTFDVFLCDFYSYNIFSFVLFHVCRVDMEC